MDKKSVKIGEMRLKKKNVLFIIHNINYSGAAKMLSFIANGLNDIGNSVMVYTYAGDTPYYPLKSRIKFLPTSKIQKHYLGKLLYFKDVRKMIKKINPDVVVSFLPNSNMFSIIGTVFTKIPVIICERSDPYKEKGFLLEFKKSLFKYADGAVFQTEGAQKYYSNSLQKKSIVIPNPVTVDRIDRIPMDKRNNDIAFVGRFSVKQKRQDIMVEAFQKVAEINKEVNLVLYGDGPDLLKIQQMVKKMNLTERVVFKGEVKDVINSIKDSKMFVITSDYEGIPNALVEAMAAGLPVISTDCSPGGARLLIEDKKNGLIVPTGDVDRITNAILFFINNSEVADQYGIEAQKIIEQYSPGKTIEMWDEYMDRIVENDKF